MPRGRGRGRGRRKTTEIPDAVKQEPDVDSDAEEDSSKKQQRRKKHPPPPPTLIQNTFNGWSQDQSQHAKEVISAALSTTGHLPVTGSGTLQPVHYHSRENRLAGYYAYLASASSSSFSSSSSSSSSATSPSVKYQPKEPVSDIPTDRSIKNTPLEKFTRRKNEAVPVASTPSTQDDCSLYLSQARQDIPPVSLVLD